MKTSYGKNYDSVIFVRLHKTDKAKLKKRFTAWLKKVGEFDSEGHRRSMNDYILSLII